MWYIEMNQVDSVSSESVTLIWFGCYFQKTVKINVPLDILFDVIKKPYHKANFLDLIFQYMWASFCAYCYAYSFEGSRKLIQKVYQKIDLFQQYVKKQQINHTKCMNNEGVLQHDRPRSFRNCTYKDSWRRRPVILNQKYKHK